MWAKNLSDKELRKTCRSLGVKGYTGMTREQMAKECILKLSKEQKLERCIRSNPSKRSVEMTLDEIDECARKATVDNHFEPITLSYATTSGNAKCKTPRSVDNDTFNDCPLFFRVGDDGCCHPSAKAKFKAIGLVAISTSFMASEIRKTLEVESVDSVRSQLKVTTLEESEVEGLVSSYTEGEKTLNDWVGTVQMTQKDLLFTLNIARKIKEEFATQLKATTEMFSNLSEERVVATVHEEERSRVWSFLKSVGSYAGWASGKILTFIGLAFRKLIAAGFDVVKYIVSHPQSARLFTFIALKYKQRICREVSIYMGKGKVTGMWDRIKGSVAEVNSYITHGLFEAIATVVSSQSLWSSMSGVINSCMSSVFVAVPELSRLIPVFGGVLSVSMSILHDTVTVAFQAGLYEKALSDTTTYVIELLDVFDCVKEYATTEEEVQIITKKYKRVDPFAVKTPTRDEVEEELQ